MHYLIDGHNLIGKLPDIKLSDPDDEIKLILRLQAWLKAAPQRQVTVVFDGGTMGGVSHRLSTRDITVVFAPPGKTADDLLIQRLQKLRNPRSFTLVSSDRRIVDAARVARIKFLRSEEFIDKLGFVFAEPEEKQPKPAPAPPADKADDPRLTDAEVAEWLDLFGPAPERPKRRRGSASVLRKKRGTAVPTEPEPEPEKRPLTPAEFAAMAESDNPELDDAEVAEWLALFGTVEKRPSAPKPEKAAKPDKAAKSGKKGRLTTMKDTRRKLTADEVDEWLQLFGGDGEK